MQTVWASHGSIAITSWYHIGADGVDNTVYYKSQYIEVYNEAYVLYKTETVTVILFANEVDLAD